MEPVRVYLSARSETGTRREYRKTRQETLSIDRSERIRLVRVAHSGAGTMAMPHGPFPAFTRPSSLPILTSTPDTSSDGPLATKSRLPSGVSDSPHGLGPTRIVSMTFSVTGSRTHTVPP